MDSEALENSKNNFAISINYYNTASKNIEVFSQRSEFKTIENALDLMTDFLESIGYSNEEVLEYMFNYSSVVQGKVRAEVEDLIKSLDD